MRYLRGQDVLRTTAEGGTLWTALLLYLRCAEQLGDSWDICYTLRSVWANTRLSLPRARDTLLRKQVYI